MSIVLLLHIIAIVIWVGGMFFAYVVLRPAAADQLEPPQRLKLWVAVFGGFFPWVWAAIVTVLGTGIWLIFNKYGSFEHMTLSIQVMFYVGIIMMLIFMHVFFAPYKRLKLAVIAEDWPAAGKKLAQIRLLVGINTLIGLTNIAIAIAGPFYL